MKYYNTLRALLEHPAVKNMQGYEQHRNTDSYCHCRHVTLKSIWMIRRFGIKADMESLVRGAMLHDYYLYDIKARGLTAWQHGRNHPQAALENAQQIFALNWREENIIYSHMWPLYLTHFPRCREAVVVNVADKLCSLEETFLWGRKSIPRLRDAKKA